MAYKKGYTRKDGTYVEGYHTNTGGSTNDKTKYPLGCKILILIPLIGLIIWIYSRDGTPLEFDIKNNSHVKIINDSILKTKNNVGLIKSTNKLYDTKYSIYNGSKIKFLNKIEFNKDTSKIFYHVFYKNEKLILPVSILYPLKNEL